MVEGREVWQTDRKLFGLSVIAGMRSMAAPALLAQDLTRRQPAALNETPFDFLRSPMTAVLFAGLALGEMVFDKLPFAPARIKPGVLTGRMMAGALVGATLSAERGLDETQGAIRGAMIAGLAAFASYILRITLGSVLSNAVAGLLEDLVVLGCGLSLIERP